MHLLHISLKFHLLRRREQRKVLAITVDNCRMKSSFEALDQRCIDAAKVGNIVIFVGAGASCLLPTSLPLWSDINAAVLRGLHMRSVDIDNPFTKRREVTSHIQEKL